MGMPAGVFDQSGIIGIQHQRPVCPQGTSDDELGGNQVFQRINPILAQMLRRDVGDQHSVSARKAQPTPQQSAACDLQQANVRALLLEHHACTSRTRVVPHVQHDLADLHVFGGVEARSQSGGLGKVRQQADGGGLAVGARHHHGGHVVEGGPLHLLWVWKLLHVPAL